MCGEEEEIPQTLTNPFSGVEDRIKKYGGFVGLQPSQLLPCLSSTLNLV